MTAVVAGVDPYKAAGLHNQLNGWMGFDNTYSEITYFRRLSSADARWGAVCVGAAGGLAGSFSFWAGAFPVEAGRDLLRNRPGLRQQLGGVH